jgi:hypothetical protein
MGFQYNKYHITNNRTIPIDSPQQAGFFEKEIICRTLTRCDMQRKSALKRSASFPERFIFCVMFYCGKAFILFGCFFNCI